MMHVSGAVACAPKWSKVVKPDGNRIIPICGGTRINRARMKCSGDSDRVNPLIRWQARQAQVLPGILMKR
ncbi:MAG: hypothetical protein H6667_13520 [Ardenticatenaceae bacterium]|nr:hypothetical protein [Ardenticatenaceae bacterium]